MKALVTGGAGFVGRHLCKALLDQGHEVTCVDPIIPRTGGLDLDDWPLYDPRDFTNFQMIKKDCREFFLECTDQFDYAFHLAAMVGGRLMIENQPLAVAEDLAIDAMYWRWAEKTRPEKTVYFSSSAAYPISMQRPDHYHLLREDMINFEDTLGMPDLSYGWAKLTGEYLSRLAFQKHGLKSVVYRPFSGFGEDQDLTYPFPAITRRLATEEKGDIVTVWGTGRQMRDFIHIEDCIDCVMKTMDKVDDASAINISSGRLTSFIELAQIILKSLGRDAEVVGTSDKPEGVFARGGDTKLQESLGFMPSMQLEEGVERMVKYHS